MGSTILSNFSELKASYKKLGPLRFWAWLGGTILLILLWVGAQFWVSYKIGWPDSYGFECRGKGCLFVHMAHSAKLLRGGSAYELTLFALLWSWVALIVGWAIYALLKRRRPSKTR